MWGRLVSAALAPVVLLAGCAAWPGSDRGSGTGLSSSPAGGEIVPRCNKLDEPTTPLDAIGLGFMAVAVAAEKPASPT